MRPSDVSMRQGTWRGIDRQSDMAPGDADFIELKNGYVSTDGTEIRRMPGWKAVMKPQFAEAFTINTFTNGATTSIKVNTNITGVTANHGLAVGDNVRIVGNSSIANGYYTVSVVVDSTEFTIAETTVSSSTDGTVYVDRLGSPHGFKQILGRTVFVGEDHATNSGASFSVVAIEIPSGGPTYITIRGIVGWDVGEPITGGLTIAGSGDATFNGFYAESSTEVVGLSRIKIDVDKSATTPTASATTLTFGTVKEHIAAWVEEDLPSAGSPPECAEYWPSCNILPTFSDQRDFFPIRRKSVLDSSEDRLLIASPGYGCCFQVPIRQLEKSLSTSPQLKKVMGLGVPKGAAISYAAATPGANAFTTGYSHVMVAYRNRVTGEIGLISEPFELNGGSNETDGTLKVALGREVLREFCLLHDILLFAFDTAGSAASAKLIYVGTVSTEASPWGRGELSITFNKTACLDNALAQTYRIPFLEQMPRGSKFIKTVRGYTLGGGALGNIGNASSVDEIYTEATGSNPEDKEIRVGLLPINVGGELLPSSYQGVVLQSPPSDSHGVTRLNVLKELWYAGATGDYRHHWDAEDSFQKDSGRYGTLLYDRGAAWFSEPGVPGVSPATNTIIFDAKNGEDLEGAGSYRNGWVVCSESETFVLSAGSSPVGQRPIRVSSEFGCVAPNSFVETEMGAYWLSRQGPVMFDGSSVRWIGRPVKELFDACKRDSRDMMPHAIVGHDRKRGLIYWGLRKDEHSTSYASISASWPDDARSKVACDYFLVWSYRAQAWSTWEPPSSLGGVWWMDTVTTDENSEELGFLAGSDWNAELYVFDDDYVDSVADDGPLSGLSQASGYVGTTGLYFYYGDAGLNDYIRVGMQWYAVDGETLYYDGAEVVAVDTVNQKVTLSMPVVWTSSTRLYLGAIPMRLKSKLVSMNARLSGQSSISSVALRYYDQGNATKLRYQINEVNAQTAEMDGYRVAKRSDSGAFEHQLTVDICSDGPVKVKDLVLEVPNRG